MATVSLSSTQITNRDASPRVRSASRIVKAQLYSSIGTLETSAADDIGSKYNLCSVPSNARMSRLLLSCDSLGTAGAADIGLYQTTENGGAVVDADFFASAQSLTSALAQSDVMLEANGANASIGKDDLEKPLWEIIGLSEDPKRDYDIVMTLTTATIDAGTVTMEALYVI